ncbi:MAG: STAS domain-containing protein [Pseudomonadales bacterium]
MAGKKKSAKLRPPERFTVEAAAEVLEAGAARIAAGKTLRIDLSDVVTIDTAALQCLVVLRTAALERGSGCAILGAPAAVRECAGMLGLGRLLEFEPPARLGAES